MAKANAMAFYHSSGMVPAWQQAMRFAGKDGRVATMPDIIQARLNTKPGDTPWESYFTTSSAEYVGYTKGWVPIIIVAHGVGPMATLEGIQAAYRYQYNDKSREVRGGRISREEFQKLESGAYGPVTVVDYRSYLRRYKYPFLEQLRHIKARFDGLLEARLGRQTFEYLSAHAAHARAWHANQAGIDPDKRHGIPKDLHRGYLDRRRSTHALMADPKSDPYIISVACESNASYLSEEMLNFHLGKTPDCAVAHLLSIGQLMHMGHSGCGSDEGVQFESLVCDVSCHGWCDGTRLLGVRPGGPIASIHQGPQLPALLYKNWEQLMIPAKGVGPIGPRVIKKIAKDTWFTQTLKRGHNMDTHVPEFHVTGLKKMGRPVAFRTEIEGFHGFFRYNAKQVLSAAPRGANLYEIVEADMASDSQKHHDYTVQFYRGAVHTKRRLMTEEKLGKDFDLMMQLMGQ